MQIRSGAVLLACTAAAGAIVACTPVAGGGEVHGRPELGERPAAVVESRKVGMAATAFLQTLDADQRRKVSFPFAPQKAATSATFARSGPPGGPGAGPPAAPGGPGGGPPGAPGGGRPAGGFPGFVGERYGQAVWSNYPVSDVPRPGLQMGSLTSGQRAAAMRLLQVVLSADGYQKVLDIMGSDEALREQGQNFASGADVYTLAIFGDPGGAKPWMLQYGGHHLALNIVIDSAHGSLTPTLTGAQPATYTTAGRTVRVLAQENDKAFALMDALSADQRQKAILNYQVGDLVQGPGHDGEVLAPEGLKASAMSPAQRALLLDLISQWAGIINAAYSEPRMEEIKAGLAETYFAWSGPTTHAAGRNGVAYYRIQGPRLLIEFSPQGVGGDPSMHVHTVYRDPANNYGRAFTQP